MSVRGKYRLVLPARGMDIALHVSRLTPVVWSRPITAATYGIKDRGSVTVKGLRDSGRATVTFITRSKIEFERLETLVEFEEVCSFIEPDGAIKQVSILDMTAENLGLVNDGDRARKNVTLLLQRVF